VFFSEEKNYVPPNPLPNSLRSRKKGYIGKRIGVIFQNASRISQPSSKDQCLYFTGQPDNLTKLFKGTDAI
jgi:hypothetical protein